MQSIDNDPAYGQLLRMVDVLSCTVEDLSKKMMLMIECKETAVSKARPHCSKDLKETRDHSCISGTHLPAEVVALVICSIVLIASFCLN